MIFLPRVPPIPSGAPQRPSAQPPVQPQNVTDPNNVYGQDQINVNGHSSQVAQANAGNRPGDDQINVYENYHNEENEVIYD